MKNVTDSFVSLGHWPSAGSFGFNTDILATNPINLSVVLGVLIFFGKGVYELHLRTISANIGMFGAMKEITD
uniref:ATP synthase CF0 B subunit n=1 Tax=Pachysandra terminalis TaxID=74825 RepID=A0A125R331_PACTE|nr:ATP synthase CF0 B subunit [Pachysandra terminalis]AMD08598.1 ATP synthase CF0 B subunit [Pachysandra terminalis]UUL97052.1 ATP synthase CF0 subunit I [Pachysandra terminalis]